MRIVFAGTPEFAQVALEHLLVAGFTVPLVLTQPDRPAGRGMKLQASPVKRTALARGIAVAQPRSLRLDGQFPEDAAAARQALRDARADAMVVAAYGLILPQWVLDDMTATKAAAPPPVAAGQADARASNAAPGTGDGNTSAASTLGAATSAPAAQTRAGGTSGAPAASGDSAPARRGLGCLNIHASLLPRWRGAAPIHRAIEAGDARTGVTIMQMDAGLDTGAMLLAESLPIAPDATTASLHDALAALGGRLIVEALELAACGGLRAQAQPETGITYAHKIDKAEARIDWTQPAAVIERRVRAFDPFPGAVTTLPASAAEAQGAKDPADALKVWSTRASPAVAPAGSVPGQVLAVTPQGIDVVCGVGADAGVLRLTELQRAGGRRLAVSDWMRGSHLPVGAVLGADRQAGDAGA